MTMLATWYFRFKYQMDHSGIDLFSRHLTKMLDGELEAFDLTQSTT